MITEEQANKIIELLIKIETNTKQTKQIYDEVNSVYHIVDDIHTILKADHLSK